MSSNGQIHLDLVKDYLQQLGVDLYDHGNFIGELKLTLTPANGSPSVTVTVTSREVDQDDGEGNTIGFDDETDDEVLG